MKKEHDSAYTMTDEEKDKLVDDLMATARELKLLADKEIAAEDEKKSQTE